MPAKLTSEVATIDIDFHSYMYGLICSTIVVDQLRANARLHAMTIVDKMLDRDILDKEHKTLVTRVKGYIMNDTPADFLRTSGHSRSSAYGILAIVATLDVTDGGPAYEICQRSIKTISTMMDEVHASSVPDNRVEDIVMFVDIVHDMRARGILSTEKFGSVGMMEDTGRLFIRLKEPLYMASHGNSMKILTVPILNGSDDIHKRVDFVNVEDSTIFTIGGEIFDCEVEE